MESLHTLLLLFSWIPAQATNCDAYSQLVIEGVLLKQHGERVCSVVCTVNLLQVIRQRLGLPPINSKAMESRILEDEKNHGRDIRKDGLDRKDLESIVQREVFFEGHKVEVKLKNSSFNVRPTPEDIVFSKKLEVKILELYLYPPSHYHTVVLLESHVNDQQTVLKLSDPEASDTIIEGTVDRRKSEIGKGLRLVLPQSLFPYEKISVASVLTVTVD